MRFLFDIAAFNFLRNSFIIGNLNPILERRGKTGLSSKLKSAKF